MKILVAHPGPSFSVHDVYQGWLSALKVAGQRVIEFPLDRILQFYDNAYMQVNPGEFRKAMPPEAAVETAVDRLASALYKTHPDVLFVVTGFLIPNELLALARYRGTKVVVLHTESPYEDVRQLEQAANADLNLINDPTNIDQFREVSPTLYMPHAYRPGFHCPGRVIEDFKSDFAFVGTGFASRIALFEAMDFDGIDVMLAGNWNQLPDDSPLRKHVGHEITECLDNDDTVRVYRASKVGMNYYRREHDDGADFAGWAMGPREIEMAATGLFFLRDPRPEGDEVLPMLPTFGSAEEASELLRWWLAHPEEREKAAAAAREAVRPRTFDANVKAFLQALA